MFYLYVNSKEDPNFYEAIEEFAKFSEAITVAASYIDHVDVVITDDSEKVLYSTDDLLIDFGKKH